MIDISHYHIEMKAKDLLSKNNSSIPNLSFLLFDFKKFRIQVGGFRFNFQGPDYFDIFDSLLELQFLLDRTIKELQNHTVDLNRIPYRPLETILNFSLENNNLIFSNDFERIEGVVLGLDKLIQSNRATLTKSKGMNDFFVESLLVDFEKELEKSRWIFYMYSNY